MKLARIQLPRVLCSRNIVEAVFQLLITDSRCIVMQESMNHAADEDRAMLLGPIPVGGIPLGHNARIGSVSSAGMASMRFRQGLRKIPVHHAIARQRMTLAAVPVGGFRMRLETMEDLQQSREASMWTFSLAEAAFDSHVSDCITDLQSGCELIFAAEAGYRRKVMFEIRLATNRTVNEGLDSMFLRGVTPGRCRCKWHVSVEVTATGQTGHWRRFL